MPLGVDLSTQDSVLDGPVGLAVALCPWVVLGTGVEVKQAVEQSEGWEDFLTYKSSRNPLSL